MQWDKEVILQLQEKEKIPTFTAAQSTGEQASDLSHPDADRRLHVHSLVLGCLHVKAGGAAKKQGRWQDHRHSVRAAGVPCLHLTHGESGPMKGWGTEWGEAQLGENPAFRLWSKVSPLPEAAVFSSPSCHAATQPQPIALLPGTGEVLFQSLSTPLEVWPSGPKDQKDHSVTRVGDTPGHVVVSTELCLCCALTWDAFPSTIMAGTLTHPSAPKRKNTNTSSLGKSFSLATLGAVSWYFDGSVSLPPASLIGEVL